MTPPRPEGRLAGALRRSSAAPSAGSVGWVLLPLRAFVGITFCFASFQKLANPNFFDARSPISIQAQLLGASRLSPIHGLLAHLLPAARPIGLLMALGELAVGLGALLGLWTRIAALGGMLISFSLFLTVSFHASPYFTGSDLVFLFAWTPLLIGGAGGVLSLDGLLGELARAELAVTSQSRATAGPPGPAGKGAEVARRTVVLRGGAAAATAVAGLATAGVVAAAGRSVGGRGSAGSPAGGSAPSSSTTSSVQGPSTGAGAGSHPGSTSAPKGTAVLTAQEIPVGGSRPFTDPASGDPALVLQHSAGDFVAFDAVCPHAGCTVRYVSSADLIVCPCHGSEFNAETGAVEAGPAPHGLKPIPVAEAADGRLYVDG